MMSDYIDRPILESYWVVPGRLLAGEYPGQLDEEVTRKRIDALIEAGFDTFVDLTKPGENVPYAAVLQEQSNAYEVPVTYQRFPIGDFGLPAPEQMKSILDAMDEALRSGRKIYVHCWGGIGRTGTTVGCYLVRQGKSGAEALEQLAEWWRGVPKSRYHPRSPETSQQREFVLRWAEHDRRSPGMA
jgi:hypothetical protein